MYIRICVCSVPHYHFVEKRKKGPLRFWPIFVSFMAVYATERIMQTTSIGYSIIQYDTYIYMLCTLYSLCARPYQINGVRYCAMFLCRLYVCVQFCTPYCHSLHGVEDLTSDIFVIEVNIAIFIVYG